MDRSPERVWVVVVAVVGGWLALGLSLFVARIRTDGINPRHLWAIHVGRYLSRLASQSGVQLLIFFVLPFYARAAAPLWGHGLFLTLLGVAAVATLWDPWHGFVLERSWLAALLHGLATFAGLNAVLPILGRSNSESLRVAALCTAVILPAGVYFLTQGQRALHTVAAGVVSVGLALAFFTGALRFVVPAAPLRLTRANVARTESNAPAEPPHLMCITQVWAPHGLHEQLFHVWFHNRDEVDRIPLSVTGGRDSGFRTWSVKQNLSLTPTGLWRCEVQTDFGQILGGAAIQVD